MCVCVCVCVQAQKSITMQCHHIRVHPAHYHIYVYPAITYLLCTLDTSPYLHVIYALVHHIIHMRICLSVHSGLPLYAYLCVCLYLQYYQVCTHVPPAHPTPPTVNHVCMYVGIPDRSLYTMQWTLIPPTMSAPRKMCRINWCWTKSG